ncbi:MAG: PspC domain-containing protein [Bacteroidaceae bacterium]|nr:PspC domain-containing protein [Bacteroidaceae bacterium]
MKKNITINLCGRLYQIDEDAYELLSHYTDTLRDYFKKQEGGEETANDIEERIAELFDDLKAQGVEAITIEHVQAIIHQIGQVEEIAGGNDAGSESSEKSSSYAKSEQARKPQNSKKFFRDSQNKLLAGVLAGCAQYFGGSADGWRWGYVILSVLWFCIIGFWPLTFTLPFATSPIVGILAVPLVVLSFLFSILPVCVYLLVVIFAPLTKTAEDTLKMKGKEVNPQNLVAEVQEATLAKERKKNGKSGWDIFVGIISVGLSTFFTIAFIVALCFFVAFLVASEQMADTWWNVYETGDLEVIYIPVICCGVLLLTSIGILLYCSIHAAVSSFGKTKSMSAMQRVIWFLLWVASTVGFIGCWVWGVSRLAKVQTARWDARSARVIDESLTDALGNVFSKEEWDFFQQNGWEMITAENVDRYTYIGEYMTGDESVRYLDDCNDYTPLVYTARKHEDDVEPGIYRLSAVVKANNENKFIYLYGVTIDEQTGDSTVFTDQVLEIPNCGLEGGNIWEAVGGEPEGKVVTKESSSLTVGAVTVPLSNKVVVEKSEPVNDPVLLDYVNNMSDRTKRRILGAHDGKGYGWSYIYIDNIKVDNPHNTIFYGVTTDESITGKPATTGWFSATDFKLEKIGDL